MPSSAVSQNAISSVVGYLLAKGYFNPNSPNLPQNINILGEANTANQSGLDLNPVTITNAKKAGDLYGNGSPIHRVACILFPSSGSGVTIPVNVYPQEAADGAVAKVITVTPTGTATANGTIYLVINGRKFIDNTYAVNIETGDTPTAICDKMRATIAAVLGCPVLGSGTTTFIATAKWAGLTSNDIKIRIDLNATDTGVTFGVVNTTAGSGTPSVSESLALFNNEWRTIVINTYGLVSATMAELEEYNGIPDPVNPTGKYAGTIWRPMWAFSGSTADDPTSITNAGARPNNVTIAVCPAPLSEGLPFEAAANMAYICGNVFQNTPASDIIGIAYPDMPAPVAGSIPQMTSQTFRQYCSERGCSTVDFYAGVYRVVDFMTTYNVEGEFPPFYRWVRDLNVHWNFKFRYHLREQQKLVGKVIVKNGDIVTAPNVVKPKMWAAEISDLVEEAVTDGLLVDKAFTNVSINVEINASNPNRLDSEFDIKISGVARVSSTTVRGGFNFSN